MWDLKTSDLPNYKILPKNKMPKSGTKNDLFGYFLGKTLKKYCNI